MEYYKMIEQIKDNLIKSQNINNSDKNASDIMAISLIDIEESNKKINSLISKLTLDAKLTGDEVYNILNEIGDEFRHVLYHIREMQFYNYLNDL